MKKRIGLICGGKSGEHEVSIRSAQSIHAALDKNKLTIRIPTKPDPKYTALFLYGTKINNLLSVDYEAISTLNVSATQELYKMINELKDENKKLKAEYEARLKAMEEKISALQVPVTVSKGQAAL